MLICTTCVLRLNSFITKLICSSHCFAVKCVSASCAPCTCINEYLRAILRAVAIFSCCAICAPINPNARIPWRNPNLKPNKGSVSCSAVSSNKCDTFSYTIMLSASRKWLGKKPACFNKLIGFAPSSFTNS